jgi:NAD(P)-dependent dehydrogenase (short-subunit alcohol dehydrogenase family)
MVARSAERLSELALTIPGSRGYAADVGDAHAVADAFARIRAELGAIDTLLYNAGSGLFAPFLDTTPDLFEAAWRVNALGLLLCAREVAPPMVAAGSGTILVTGATASLRGGLNFAAFAPAKAAQRSLAQAMARNLGPHGIHVGYVIVDGVIDIPITRAMLSDRPDDFFLAPDAIAETFWQLAHQDRSAWTFELDVRPFGEKW